MVDFRPVCWSIFGSKFLIIFLFLWFYVKNTVSLVILRLRCAPNTNRTFYALPTPKSVRLTTFVNPRYIRGTYSLIDVHSQGGLENPDSSLDPRDCRSPKTYQLCSDQRGSKQKVGNSIWSFDYTSSTQPGFTSLRLVAFSLCSTVFLLPTELSALITLLCRLWLLVRSMF